MKFIDVNVNGQMTLINLENVIQIRPDAHGNAQFCSLTTVINSNVKYEQARVTLTGLVPTPSLP